MNALGGLESNQEAEVALGYASRNFARASTTPYTHAKA